MAFLTVGVGQQFATVGAAVAASHDGDTLYVQAGTYTNDFSTVNTKISIVGVGGMAHFVATGSIPNGKAIFITNNDVTFDHIEFSGASVPSVNGAGIRQQAGNLTVTNSYFHNNQDGILGNAIAGFGWCLLQNHWHGGQPAVHRAMEQDHSGQRHGNKCGDV